MVPVEEHHGTRIVQLVHLTPFSSRALTPTESMSYGFLKGGMRSHLSEVRHLGDVHEVDDSKVLDLL